MRGRGLFCRKAPSLALPLEKTGVGERWGRGRFSKRSASPPDPLSRRVAGNRLARSSRLACPCEVGTVSCFGVVVTAADRAAATYAAWGTNPSARLRRAPPLSGEALQEACPKAPSAEGAFWIAHTSLNVSQRWQVAAALSAAVTITKQQGTAPTPQAKSTMQKSTRQTPAALRERGSGGEALLSEKRPLPQNLPIHSLFGREREGGGFSEEKPPPSHISLRA